MHQCICFAVGVLNSSFWKELFAYGFLNGETLFYKMERGLLRDQISFVETYLPKGASEAFINQVQIPFKFLL